MPVADYPLLGSTKCYLSTGCQATKSSSRKLGYAETYAGQLLEEVSCNLKWRLPEIVLANAILWDVQAKLGRRRVSGRA
jgi:hypothetical protein